MGKSRKINRLLSGRPTIEGAGVHRKRIFGYYEARMMDPFLMLDHFGSSNPRDYLAVLHDPNAAFMSGDHFIFLKGGRVLEVKEGKAPWDDDFLSDVYGTPIKTIPFQDRSIVVPF